MNKRKTKSLAAIFMAMTMVFSAGITMNAADSEHHELQFGYTDHGENVHYQDCCSSTAQPHQDVPNMFLCWILGCWDSGITRNTVRHKSGGNDQACHTYIVFRHNLCGWTWTCNGAGYVSVFGGIENGTLHRFRTEWIGMGSFQICTGCGFIR